MYACSTSRREGRRSRPAQRAPGCSRIEGGQRPKGHHLARREQARPLHHRAQLAHVARPQIAHGGPPCVSGANALRRSSSRARAPGPGTARRGGRCPRAARAGGAPGREPRSTDETGLRGSAPRSPPGRGRRWSRTRSARRPRWCGCRPPARTTSPRPPAGAWPGGPGSGPGPGRSRGCRPRAISIFPSLASARVGEGSALVTEQLRLEKLLGDRRAVDPDERARRCGARRSEASGRGGPCPSRSLPRAAPRSSPRRGGSRTREQRAHRRGLGHDPGAGSRGPWRSSRDLPPRRPAPESLEVVERPAARGEDVDHEAAVVEQDPLAARVALGVQGPRPVLAQGVEDGIRDGQELLLVAFRTR